MFSSREGELRSNRILSWVNIIYNNYYYYSFSPTQLCALQLLSLCIIIYNIFFRSYLCTTESIIDRIEAKIYYLIDTGGPAPFAVAGLAQGGRSFRRPGSSLVRVRTAVHVGSADV